VEELRRRAEVVGEIEGLAETDEQVDLVARRQRGMAYRDEDLTRLREIGWHRALSILLEQRARHHERCGITLLRLTPRQRGRGNGAVVVPLVVLGPRLGKGRRVGRPGGRGAGKQKAQENR